MADERINSIGLFIDGNYFTLIDRGLRQEGRRINVKGLLAFIQESVADKYDLDPDSCIITETHFFRGRYRAHDAQKNNTLLDDRRFEDRLIENDVVLHYKHVYNLPDGTPHEKGIDVWFALETLELAMYRDFDFVVMITGDADFEILARKIKSLKIPVILLTWHYDKQDSTAKALREEITCQIDVNKMLDVDPGLKNRISEPTSV
ncbi:MAG: NYN domain-containing protein [Bacteroidales bacterium]|nr:NYN domain-containing protein [Bacteroidales bacterium]